VIVVRRPTSGVRGQGSNHDNPHRLHRRRRPSHAWHCREFSRGRAAI
jgi:hypothetical protein